MKTLILTALALTSMNAQAFDSATAVYCGIPNVQQGVYVINKNNSCFDYLEVSNDKFEMKIMACLEVMMTYGLVTGDKVQQQVIATAAKQKQEICVVGNPSGQSRNLSIKKVVTRAYIQNRLVP